MLGISLKTLGYLLKYCVYYQRGGGSYLQLRYRLRCGKNLASTRQSCCNRQIRALHSTPFKYPFPPLLVTPRHSISHPFPLEEGASCLATPRAVSLCATRNSRFTASWPMRVAWSLCIKWRLLSVFTVVQKDEHVAHHRQRNGPPLAGGCKCLEEPGCPVPHIAE